MSTSIIIELHDGLEALELPANRRPAELREWESMPVDEGPFATSAATDDAVDHFKAEADYGYEEIGPRTTNRRDKGK